MRSENKPSDSDELSFIERARRAQLIGCTIETIATLGYGQASLAQIAKRAGVSKGVISYHFKSKDELIEQTAAAIFEAFGAFMGPQIDAEVTPRKKLEAIIRSNLAFMQRHRQHLATLLEILANARPLPAAMAETHQRSLCELENFFRWGQEVGEFRAFSPSVMALVVRNAIDLAAGKIAATEDFDVDLYARELIALFDRATCNSKETAHD
jgi:TetR/AcrR family transcriptional regulator, fatty acid metabolism regulator protein